MFFYTNIYSIPFVQLKKTFYLCNLGDSGSATGSEIATTLHGNQTTFHHNLTPDTKNCSAPQLGRDAGPDGSEPQEHFHSPDKSQGLQSYNINVE